MNHEAIAYERKRNRKGGSFSKRGEIYLSGNYILHMQSVRGLCVSVCFYM